MVPDDGWMPASPQQEWRLFRDLSAVAAVSIVLLALALYAPDMLPGVIVSLAGVWAVYVLMHAAVDAHQHGMRRIRR